MDHNHGHMDQMDHSLHGAHADHDHGKSIHLKRKCQQVLILIIQLHNDCRYGFRWA